MKEPYITRKEIILTICSGFVTTYFLFQRSKSAELIITNTEPQLCTKAPMTGFRIPVIASMIATKFNVIEKVRFNLIFVIIFFASPIKCGTSLISSSTSAMSAASTAISLPIPPMAIPTCAFFKAGASLIPSRPVHPSAEIDRSVPISSPDDIRHKLPGYPVFLPLPSLPFHCHR